LVCLLRIYAVRQAEFGSSEGGCVRRPVIGLAENEHPVHRPREVFLIVGLQFAANIWPCPMHDGIFAAGSIQVKTRGAGAIGRQLAVADLCFRA